MQAVLEHDDESGAGHLARSLQGAAGLTSEDAVLAAFHEWDTDGKGKISQEDLLQILMLLSPHIPLESLGRVFSDYDVNKDGFLDYSEFVSWIFGASACDAISIEKPPPDVCAMLPPPEADAEVTGTALLLDRPKEPSCPGSLLVSSGDAFLTDRITLLGGMLAHPYIGVYPYREGHANTIVAAHMAPSSHAPLLPTPLERALSARAVELTGLDVFFVISDISSRVFARAAALNIMHHPWCYPTVRPGQTVGAGLNCHIGLHVPTGGGVVAEPRSRALAAATRRRDADPEGAALDTLVPTSVFVHPSARGDLACSPNNVRLRLPTPTKTVATVWAACVQDAGPAARRASGSAVRSASSPAARSASNSTARSASRATATRAGSTRSPSPGRHSRACVSLHWLVTNAEVAQTLSRMADEAATLREFLTAASSELSTIDAPATAAAATAFGLA